MTAQIAMLQGELHITVAAAESPIAIVARRDASIMLATTQLETAHENDEASSLAPAQANSALVGTIRAFWGLAIQVGHVLVTLGLRPLPIPYETEGIIAL
jgi:hypothetical protein